MCVAAILENGGPKGSREGGHEFWTPGVYTCIASETTPYMYASRAYIGLPGDDTEKFTPWDAAEKPYSLFVFCGCETEEGKEFMKTRKTGSEMQRIYKEDYLVFWKELRVWIGCPVTEKSPFSHYHSVEHYIPGDRRSTRLIKKTPHDLLATRWVEVDEHRKVIGTRCHPLDDVPECAFRKV